MWVNKLQTHKYSTFLHFFIFFLFSSQPQDRAFLTIRQVSRMTDLWMSFTIVGGTSRRRMNFFWSMCTRPLTVTTIGIISAFDIFHIFLISSASGLYLSILCWKAFSILWSLGCVTSIS